MVGVGRDLCGSSSPTLLPKQGQKTFILGTAEELAQTKQHCKFCSSSSPKIFSVQFMPSAISSCKYPMGYRETGSCLRRCCPLRLSPAEACLSLPNPRQTAHRSCARPAASGAFGSGGVLAGEMFSAPLFKRLKTQTRDELKMQYFRSAKHFSARTVAPGCSYK